MAIAALFFVLLNNYWFFVKQKINVMLSSSFCNQYCVSSFFVHNFTFCLRCCYTTQFFIYFVSQHYCKTSCTKHCQCNILCNKWKNCNLKQVTETILESRTWFYFLQQFQLTFCSVMQAKLHEKLHSVTVP